MTLDLQARTLPRLITDLIQCLSMAQDQVDDALRNKARVAIMALRDADVTDLERTASIVRDTADHLAAIETNLEAIDRPFTARKVRAVRQRVRYLTLI